MLPRVDTNVELTFTFIIDVKCLECFIVGPNGFNMMPKEALVYQKTHMYISIRVTRLYQVLVYSILKCN